MARYSSLLAKCFDFLQVSCLWTTDCQQLQLLRSKNASKRCIWSCISSVVSGLNDFHLIHSAIVFKFGRAEESWWNSWTVVQNPMIMFNVTYYFVICNFCTLFLTKEHHILLFCLCLRARELHVSKIILLVWYVRSTCINIWPILRYCVCTLI